MKSTLIICIGNVARGDDGVGHAVAALLAGKVPENTTVTVAVDLDVAMAFDVARSDTLVVVDAVRRSIPGVSVEPIPTSASGRATGHGMDAPTLLSLASSLYDQVPALAVVVGVAAPTMGHGEGLSRIAEAASQEAASAILEIVLASHRTE